VGEVIRLRRRIAACRRLDAVNADVGCLRSPTGRDVEMRDHVNFGRGCSSAARGSNVAPTLLAIEWQAHLHQSRLTT
jgi:hypothetical protein